MNRPAGLPLGGLNVLDVVIPLGPVPILPPGNHDPAAETPFSPILNFLGEYVATASGGPAGEGGLGLGNTQQRTDTNIAERQERLATEEDNRQLLKDAGRLRKWKDRLQQDNKDLREESERLKENVQTLEKKTRDGAEEMKKLKDYYEEVLQEKIALAEQVSGPAKLPLEILLMIGGFIAGDNNYETLLSFTTMSKRIKEEMKPVFYETVFIWNPKDLVRESADGGGGYVDAYKYTKFAYTRRETGAISLRAACPNLHLVIDLKNVAAASAVSLKAVGKSPADFAAHIIIDRPTQSTVLFSLLRYPVNWKTSVEPLFAPIRAITSITVWEGGALIGERPRNEAIFFHNIATTCAIEIIESPMGDEHVEETVHELGRLVPLGLESARTSSGNAGCDISPCLVFVPGSQGAINALINALPDLLNRQPRLIIRVHGSIDVGRAEFKENTLMVASAYGQVWNMLKLECKKRGRPASFFTMHCPLSPEWEGEDEDSEDEDEAIRDVVLLAHLKYSSTTESFVTQIFEIDDFNGTEEAILAQPFVIESGGA